MKFNKSQCSPLRSSNCCDPGFISIPENVTSLYAHQVLSQCFFKCFCKETCTSKKRLDLSRSTVYQKIKRSLEDIDIPALLVFLQKHQDIAHINLAGNNISDNGFINLIDHFCRYKNIEELDVQNNNIMEKGINYMLKVAEVLEIERLNLKANKFGVKAAQKVALFLLKNEYMLYLNVSETDQTGSSLIYFIMVLSSEQDISNTTLKSLDISRPNPGCMYYFDSVHFSNVIGHMLKHNTSLRALHLQKYNFSCHDIENMMSNAKYNNTLHLLDLGCNNIGDHGVDQFANWLAKRPALKILILHSNIITDHGARALSFALPFSKLLSLDISYNKITDDGMVDVLHTLKKSPLLRELKIFGNCIGHPAAKIIKRMLVSQVLDQESIDIKPYRVDHKWYIARYQGRICKKKYDDVPYGLFSQVPSAPINKIVPKKTYYNYIHSEASGLQLQHSMKTITVGRDCKCCYCLKCDGLDYDAECRDVKHPDTCICCKCKGDESSDWSADKAITDRVISPPDPMQNITYILKRVNSKTQKNILKWINIDENILKEDLKIITGESVTEESSSEDTVPCTCSWVQLSVPTLKKYLKKDSSKELLVIPKDGYIANIK